MNRLSLNALAASLLVFAACHVQSQEVKIGYVNSDRVLREANPAKAAQAKLEAEFSKRDKEMGEIAASAIWSIRIANSSASAASFRKT